MKTWHPTVVPLRPPDRPPRLGPGLARMLVWLPATAALALYLSTLAPGLSSGRSAELALRAARLDVAHSPHPLHTLLGFGFARVADDPVAGTNVLSAFATAVAVGLVTLAARRLSGSAGAAIAAAAGFAVVPVVWRNAIVTEAHAVDTLAATGALLALVRWRDDATPRRLGVFLGSLAAMVLAWWPTVVSGALFRGLRGEDALLASSYMLATVVIACGLPRLWQSGSRTRWILAVSCVAAMATTLAVRLPEIRDVARESARVGAFVSRSLDVFPANALVVTKGPTYMMLLYAQATRSARADVTLLERWETPGREPFDGPTSWRADAVRAIRTRPVVVDTDAHGLGLYGAEAIDADWHRLIRTDAGPPELPDTAARRRGDRRSGAPG